MKTRSLSHRKNLEIFSQNITPIQNYILTGDNNEEHEIKQIYLLKLSARNKILSRSKINIYNSFNPSSYKTEISTNEKRTNLTSRRQKNLRGIKEEDANQVGSSDADSNDNIYFNQNISNINKSFNDKSSEFLLTLFNQGLFHEEQNQNAIKLTQKQIDKFKLKNNNPFLFSFNSMHPFSLFYNTKYEQLVKKNGELRLPAPNFITKEEWCKPEDNSLKGIFDGIYINDKSGLVITDPVVKKKFSGLIKDIIFQILKVPFGHHISLNVKMFEPKTILERYTSTFSYANIFLLPASHPKLTPYERFKLVICFEFAGSYIACQQLKPFNPFDGETFQGELPNGAKLYAENVTHKPLVVRFLLIYKKKYEISGYWDIAVKTQSFGSEMLINQKGPIYVKFPEINECIICNMPCVKAVNATSETSRALLFYGTEVFIDVKNKLKAVIQYDCNKNRFHEVKGCTMKYEYPENYRYIFDKEWEFGSNFEIEDAFKRKKSSKKNKIEDKYEILENIKGSWVENLYIGDKKVWDANKQKPEQIKRVKHCIPSDGRYREDLIWLYRSFYGAKNKEEEEIYRSISNEWKVMMEEFNRWERKNKAAYKEKMKKK